MPRSIPKGLTREHVIKALADLDAGVEHSFGRATGYELVYGGKRYAPKAVVLNEAAQDATLFFLDGRYLNQKLFPAPFDLCIR